MPADEKERELSRRFERWARQAIESVIVFRGLCPADEVRRVFRTAIRDTEMVFVREWRSTRSTDDLDWNDWPKVNRRRGKLIDKRVAGTLTEIEEIELGILQLFATDYIGKHAPRRFPEFGPQSSPSSLPKILAETQQIEREVGDERR